MISLMNSLTLLINERMDKYIYTSWGIAVAYCNTMRVQTSDQNNPRQQTKRIQLCQSKNAC